MTVVTWTAANAAELDVLVWQLVDAYFDHRESGCVACSQHDQCRAVYEAIEHVLRWRQRRQLLSGAEAHRLWHLAALGELLADNEAAA